MPAQHIIHTVQMARFHNGLRPADALLSGLKDQFHRAVQPVPQAHQQLCGAQPDGGVPVVAAGVHNARAAGSKALSGGPVFPVRALGHRQRIDIKAQRRRWALPAAQDADHTRKAAPRGG